MQTSRFWKLVLLLSTVTACSAQPSAKDLAKELKTIVSWTATAQMVGESWLKHSVPVAYAKQTLQATQKELHKEAGTIGKVAPAQYHTAVIQQIQQIEQTVDDLKQDVETDDRNALTQSLQQLSAQKQALDQLNQRIAESP